MIRRVEKYKDGDGRYWMCKDCRKGKKGNGCKNLIVSEDELLEEVLTAMGCQWDGVDNVNEGNFENVKKVRIYEDGRIKIKFEQAA